MFIVVVGGRNERSVVFRSGPDPCVNDFHHVLRPCVFFSRSVIPLGLLRRCNGPPPPPPPPPADGNVSVCRGAELVPSPLSADGAAPVSPGVYVSAADGYAIRFAGSG